MNHLNKLKLAGALILLFVLVVNTVNAQPPPPPPPDTPPCWPPPCIPVDNGIIYAIIAAAAFGAYTFIRARRTRSAG
jgi:hypothetical protein